MSRIKMAGAAAVFAGALHGCAPAPPAGPLAAGDNAAFHHEVETSAPPEAIWALWSDAESWARWDRGLKGATLEGPMQVGATGQITPLSGPPVGFKVLEYAPPSHYAFATELPLARLIVRRSIVGFDPTRIRHDVSFEGPLAPLWAAQFGPQFRAALPPTMDALVREAEATAAPARDAQETN